MRRVAMVIVLVVAGSMWPIAGAVAGGSPAPTVGALQADFNNDGADDLAVGVPRENVGGAVNAGVVNVLYGSGAGLTGAGSQQFTQVGSGTEAGDEFGASLASGDFNNDGFADLAVGAPFENVGATVDAGAVSVLYGSGGGLTISGAQTFVQPVSAVEEEDRFGWSLAAGDFNNDGPVDLAVGAPFENVGTIIVAGAVSALYGSGGGLTTSGAQTFVQVGGAVEVGDLFGEALASGDFNNDGFADLAAGARGETVGSAVGDLFGEALASGDFNNDGFADLAAGARGETVGSAVDAGAVSELFGSAGRLTTSGGQLFHQNSAGVPGVAEEGDFFGAALAVGDAGPATTAASPSAKASGARRTGSSRR